MMLSRLFPDLLANGARTGGPSPRAVDGPRNRFDGGLLQTVVERAERAWR